MPTYTCEKCARIFKQKSGYKDHMKKKIDCTAVTAIAPILEEMKEMKREIQEMKHQAEITQETLPQFYEDLHNLLWNRAGLNPEPALEHMTFFFAYRLIELQAEHLELPKECHWGYIASLKKEDDLYDAIMQGTESFWMCPITQPFFKPHAIKKASLLYEIVQQINRIPLSILQQTDAIGDIFEYMLGRGMSTMPDHGQYFTNRTICKLAFKLAYQIKKTLRRADGSLCTFADWFCGTGGFPAEYIKGVNKNLADIDWKTESGAIYCQDMNMNSVTNTLLNLLILTGVPFSGTTIRSSNSFSDPIIGGANAPFPNLSIDYSFTNGPYGGDKSKGKEYKFAYTKGKGSAKQYLVNDDIKSIGIEDDDKVSAGVQLAMATLSFEGVCCIVLPQGFFFGASKKCIELRKKLAEEYKIWYIVDIASGAFLNTGAKTSMMVFQKGVGATEIVSFIGLDEMVLVEATLEELRAKNYSLNYKQYLPQSSGEIDGFEMVKLGDIAKPTSMKHHSTTDGKNTGMYPLISSALSVEYYMDTFDSDTPSLIFNTINADGNCSVHYYEKFNTTSNTYILTCENTITLQYLYYYLKTQPDILKSCFEGTTKKALSRPLLQSIEIPLPSIEKQHEIVEQIDFYTQMAHTEEQSLKILEKIVMGWVKEMGRGKERVKLETIAQDITFGFMISSDDYGNEGVPVIKTKNIKSNRVLYPACDQKIKTVLHDKYRIKKGDMMIVLGGSPGETGMWEFDEEAWLNQDCAKISIEHPITKMYVFYSLQGQSFDEYIEANTTKTTIGHISRGVVREIEIPLPSLAEQQTLQSDFDEICHKHAKIAEYKAKAQAAIQRLIPGANTETVPQEAKSSEAHSSQCQVKEDGSGCTCRITIENINEEKEEREEKEILVAAQPAVKRMRPKLAKK
jgi:type I restriction enzyme S subunit